MADDAHPEDAGSGPDRTEDGRWIVVDGRRWRASDPRIPQQLRAELVAELMDARRAVRDGRGDDARVARARARVQDAKVALGERGEPWWEATDGGRRARLAATIRSLLRHRDPGSTICPSDAARIVGGDGWRLVMPLARATALELAAGAVVEIRQRGEPVTLAEGEAADDSLHGPIRIARGPDFPADLI